MKKDSIKTPLSKELSNMVLAVVIITLIFAYNWLDPAKTLGNFKALFFPVIVSFVLYELAQRLMANKFHCNAVYTLWLPGVIFSLMLMLVGIKLVLIGGILISAYKFGRWGMKDRLPTIQEIGFISTIGPLTNISLALVFKILSSTAGANPFFAHMSMVNSWLALFNLVPIKQLDGGNVMFWHPMIWFVLLFLTVLLLTPFNILSFML